jgi:hypothetical protein
VQRHQAFRLAAILWVAYAVVPPLPALLGYPSVLAQAIVRAIFGLIIAWFFWSRGGRGIAIVGTVLSFFSIPLAFMAVTNVGVVPPIYLGVAAVGLALFLASAYSWWLTTRWGDAAN